MELEAEITWLPTSDGGRTTEPVDGVRSQLKFGKLFTSCIIRTKDGLRTMPLGTLIPVRIELFLWKEYVKWFEENQAEAREMIGCADIYEHFQPGKEVRLHEGSRLVAVGRIVGIDFGRTESDSHRVTMIELAGRQPLQVRLKQVGTIWRPDAEHQPATITLQAIDGANKYLHDAVDLGEMLDVPRVFLLEGTLSDRFMLLGGCTAYALATDGAIISTFRLLRTRGTEEYWSMQFVKWRSNLVVVFEAGILVIDSELRPVWQHGKLFNDTFVSLEGDTLTFLRDHEEKWQLQVPTD